jgi:O-succinylbenzoic acid--CoA ligase
LTPDKNIKSTLVGGGFIDDELMFHASKEGWNPIRVYGSSETCSFITAANAKEIESKPNTVGKSLKNCELKISIEGEILIFSNSLFKGYLTEDFKIEKSFVNNFYASGDIGYLDNDGYLFIEAKRTDLIITGGENVNPFEVENQILKIDGVQEVCVFPESDKEWGQIIAAAIVTKRNLSDKEVIEFLRGRLSGYKIPKKFYFTDSLPKISIEKIDRKKIIELYTKPD